MATRSPRVLLLVGAGLCSLTSLAAAQRPTTVALLPGVIEIRSITYTPDTLPDITKPAAGSGEMVLMVGGVTIPKPGVTFTNLLTDANGKLIGIGLPADKPITYDIPGGVKLRIPSGQTDVLASGELRSQGKGELRFPFRSDNGQPVTAEVDSFSGGVNSGAGNLTLKGIRFNNLVAREGLGVPGLRIQTQSADYALSWQGSNPAKWKLAFLRTTVNVALPGLPAEPALPVRCQVQDLTVDQDGNADFSEVSVETNGKLTLPELAGFEITVKGGKVAYSGGMPRFSQFTADVQFPKEIASNRRGDPLKLPNVGLDFDRGTLAEIREKFSAFISELEIEVDRAVLDLSTTVAPSQPQGRAVNPAWQGLWITSGSCRLPVAAEKPKVDVKDLFIDGLGLSGEVGLTLTNVTLDGFKMESGRGALAFVNSQLSKGEFAGDFQVPTIGKVGAKVSFGVDGKYLIRATAEKIEFKELGASLTKLKGTLTNSKLVLSGELGFDASFVNAQTSAGMPVELGRVKFGVEDFAVGSDGKVFLPESGWVTFADPVELDFKAFLVEVRQVGFTSANNKITSIDFAGGARLAKALDGLPASGGLDFEGFKVGTRDGNPFFEIGGIELELEIPSIGSVSGSLFREKLPGFGDTLYGDADLKLTALGDMAGGIGVKFLIAPEKGAWFIGGSVETPPILVSVPAAPSPIPIFTVNGFAGGLGFNLAISPTANGRITDPANELVYTPGSLLMQIGVLLADPVVAAPGRIWWADTALTINVNPIVVDLTARMAFLDVEGARYIDLDEWEQLDRIARASMTIDTRNSSFRIGADAEFFLPARSFSLLEVTGEAELKIAPREAYFRMGWTKSGQKPLRVRFAQVAGDIAEISASLGMELVFDLSSKTRMTTSGAMEFDARAVIETSGIRVGGGLNGELEFRGLGTANLTADGTLTLWGEADFGFFTAYGEASLDASLNRDRLRLTGILKGRAGVFEGETDIELVLPTKK